LFALAFVETDAIQHYYWHFSDPAHPLYASVDRARWGEPILEVYKALDGVLAAGAAAGDLRVYAGYCGWGPGQLDNEMRLGAWYLMDASSAVVFDPNPATVWNRLIARTEARFALVLRPPAIRSW